MKEIEDGTKVVCKYGFNDILNKPFEFIYDFGYYSTTEGKCIVYICGERNMQDSYVMDIDNVRIATDEDLKNFYKGR